MVYIGVVKSYSTKNGFGFITPIAEISDENVVQQLSDPDTVFVHVTSIAMNHPPHGKRLFIGEYVQYNLKPGHNREELQAGDVTGVFDMPLLYTNGIYRFKPFYRNSTRPRSPYYSDQRSPSREESTSRY